MVVKKSVEMPETPRQRRELDKKKTKALLVAQEISFAKVLAGNDKKLRDRGVKRLRKWLSARSKKNCDLKNDDFMRLWRGLYYCMWMADKPLFQEELAETISGLVHCFHSLGPSIIFMEGFFRTMSLEWKGIDQHRLDKFLMLIRRFLRQCLVLVEQHGWNEKIATDVAAVFQATLLPDMQNQEHRHPPLGLVMHFTEIFLEELAKVSKGELHETILLCFLKPFAQYLATVKDGRIRTHIKQHIFIRLLSQSSVGLEYQDKFAAWSRLGFPGGSIDVMERAEDEDAEEEEMEAEDEVMQNAMNAQSALDPRAGRVDVELPLINFRPKKIALFLGEYRIDRNSNSKSRKVLTDLIRKFEKLDEGEYPLGIKEVPEIPSVNMDELTEEAAEDLFEFENSLRQDSDGIKDDEDVDDIKENGDEPLTKLQTKGAKRKKVKPEVTKKIKCSVDKPDISDESSLEPSVGKSKKLKKSVEAAKSRLKHLSKSVDAVEISSSVPSEGSPLKNAVVSESSATSKPADSDLSDINSGTKALLKHLAPHLTSKKPKRRASCDARLEGSVEGQDHIISRLSDSGKKAKKRKSCNWDEPLKEGEYEIFIPREKILAQKKRLSDANNDVNLQRSPSTKVKNPFSSPMTGAKLSTPGSSAKKVNFVLQRNTAQATSDYFRTLRENPSIPFDAKKEPTRSALKPSPYNSPVNPFYHRKLKM